jgi:glycosyltransferase involved in cell wall biosynthesis
MDILFIHGNYPAQFQHLAARLAADPANRVVFLTAREDASHWPLPAVSPISFEIHRVPAVQTHRYLQPTEQAVLAGQAVVRAIDRLLQDGFRPRMVVFHGGNGLGFFLRDLLPDSLLIAYMEWYFQWQTSRYLFSDPSFDNRLFSHARNLPIVQELVDCDMAVVPTEWQKNQFPPEFHEKLNVIFDGVDLRIFHPAVHSTELLLDCADGSQLTLLPQHKIVSYATRGMEPLRGFPEFMQLVPALVAADPDVHVVIAGSDRQAYSYPAPCESGSWKHYMLDQLGVFPGAERVHFTGSLSYVNYIAMLQRSDLHVYFTRPYVVSWGLFQALACGANLMVNRSPAVDPVVSGYDVLMVDLDQPAEIECLALDWLNSGRWHRRLQPRSSALPLEWQLEHCLQQWADLLNRGLSLTRSRWQARV